MIDSISLPAPNGERYPRVGGARERRFDGANLKPRNLPENAQTPTRRVHAVLGTRGLCLSVSGRPLTTPLPELEVMGIFSWQLTGQFDNLCLGNLESLRR